MSKYKKDKYINLKINGRLFPSFILANFKQYKLPDIMQTSDDPCITQQKEELLKYQLFISKYLDYNSIYKNILIYHSLGSGKTVTAINLYNVLYNVTPGWNVFILLKATLYGTTWVGELEKWLEQSDYEFRRANIIPISYDAPNADKLFLDKVKQADASKKSLYIIDEAHNFIRNVYSNVSSQKGKRAITIYDYIINDQKENDQTRVVLLSGTPAINNPYELAILFNLLRPGIFTKSETQFNQEFILSSAYKTLNPARKNIFQRRIMGLVSYYIGASSDYFAGKHLNYIDVPMSKYQEEIYTYFEGIEEALARKQRAKSSMSETYKSYTRQSCNFVFPLMAQGYSGELRPRPKGFKLNEASAQKLQEGKLNVDQKEESYYDVKNYIEATETFIKKFDEHLQKIIKTDVDYSLVDDVKKFHGKYNDNYVEFYTKETKKSNLYNELHKCSAKMLSVIFNILISPGPVLVYSNYVLMEGLQIFKIYLKYFGFSSINDSSSVDDFRYAEYHGGINETDRRENKAKFNEPENSHGKICKIMLISPAGAEGISLYSVRQVHLIEPYWNEVRMEQMIGRAIRTCSHKYLPKEERHVEIYRYKSVREGENRKQTTDQYIENLARGKEGLIHSFLDAMKEVAVDCVLNNSHNSLIQDYKCFQFDENSLFDTQIGPAYKDDFYDDLKIDNGSNSLKSQTIRIKIKKIKAVKLLSNPNKETPVYSNIGNYWYNHDTGIVYDYDLHYPIGKIGYDDEHIPKKLEADVYIIEKLIPIPLIEDK